MGEKKQFNKLLFLHSIGRTCEFIHLDINEYVLETPY